MCQYVSILETLKNQTAKTQKTPPTTQSGPLLVSLGLRAFLHLGNFLRTRAGFHHLLVFVGFWCLGGGWCGPRFLHSAHVILHSAFLGRNGNEHTKIHHDSSSFYINRYANCYVPSLKVVAKRGAPLLWVMRGSSTCKPYVVTGFWSKPTTKTLWSKHHLLTKSQMRESQRQAEPFRRTGTCDGNLSGDFLELGADTGTIMYQDHMWCALMWFGRTCS